MLVSFDGLAHLALFDLTVTDLYPRLDPVRIFIDHLLERPQRAVIVPQP